MAGPLRPYTPLFLYTFNDTPKTVTMCTDPKIFNGYETSCRECDQCVATYKNSWVSRCVAEKNTSAYAYAFTLTYADVDGEPPLGARVYRYRDVELMWKRIRSAAKRKWGENIDLRYVIVGEKGTRFGRCHYHGVMFSSHPVIELGKMTSRYGGGFTYKRRLDWSIWGHGFVEFQRADRKGIAYVLKYILKARMTAARSKGFGREGKTEWLASSYLWCSKRPAVGVSWLFQKLEDLVERGTCPPSLRVRVSGGGDWYVSGPAQKEMCVFLHHANNQFRKERGRDLAGWSTLVASVADEIELSDTGELVKRKPWEWLLNGEKGEEIPEYTEAQAERDREQFQFEFRKRQAVRTSIADARRVVRQCGNIIPCKACLDSRTDEQRANLEQEYLLRFDEWLSRHWRTSHDDRRRAFEEWWLTRLRPSRACGLRENPAHLDNFHKLVPVTKAQRGLTYKKAIGKGL